jgi:hypothetical protein
LKLITPILLSLIIAFLSNVAFAASWGYDGHRIAISADGNSAPDYEHKWPTGDPDDWGATPATLAILAKLNLQEKLVHFSYNNFIEAPAGPNDENQMKIGVDGAIQWWGFAPGKFFDVTKDLAAARGHLKNEMAKSTAKDPLYFIHMGPAEFFYGTVKEAVDEGHGAALAHVYIVSHSGFNDDHLRRDSHHTMKQAIAYSKDRLNYKRIKDQNGGWDPHLLWNSGKDFSPWYWLRDHSDPNMQWLYTRAQAHSGGTADISDAGMLYWLLTGDEDGSPAKFKAFIGNGVPSKATYVPKKITSPDLSSGELLVIEAEGFALKGKWEKVAFRDGSGGAYIQYMGPNKYDEVDPVQTIETTFNVSEAGTYTVKWAMRQPDEAEGDKSNDVWICFPDATEKGGGTELTGFHKFVGRSKGVFGINGQYDLHGNQPWMNVSFDHPGTYSIQLSGRSEFLQIDHFILYKGMTFEAAQRRANGGAVASAR